MPGNASLKWIDTWNRRLHSYVGLYLLLFVWVFAVSGLILNHPKWRFSEFWSSRQESVREGSVRISAAPSELDRAKDLMGQLGLSGEIDQIKATPDHFEFRLSRPSQIISVAVDPASGKAVVKQIKLNTWGILSGLHHLTGVHADNPALTRNRMATWAWSLSMDAVSLGVLFLALGGVWIWYRRNQNHWPGLIALMLGMLSCGFFAFAL
jgi:hypothetical protein